MDARWWVVVADASRARIFEAAELPEPLREIEDLVQPEGRMPERALQSDRPGALVRECGWGPSCDVTAQRAARLQPSEVCAANRGSD